MSKKQHAPQEVTGLQVSKDLDACSFIDDPTLASHNDYLPLINLEPVPIDLDLPVSIDLELPPLDFELLESSESDKQKEV